MGELVVEPHGLAETETGASDGAGEFLIRLQSSRFAANLRTKSRVYGSVNSERIQAHK